MLDNIVNKLNRKYNYTKSKFKHISENNEWLDYFKGKIKRAAIAGSAFFMYVTLDQAISSAFSGRKVEQNNQEKIAFVSDRDGNAEIYVMNADGTNVKRLTDNPMVDYNPAWSPDESKIAFTSDRDGNGEIYVMNADGSNQTNLTNNPAWDSNPAWSPDGSKIAFVSNRDGNNEIYVMNADGTNPTRLTNNYIGDSEPAWSPNGSKIVFASNKGDGNLEIYVMNADGTNPTRLTNNPAWDSNPAWSPNESKIAFTSARDGNAEIYVMNADGSNQTRLTDNPAPDGEPAWSPNESKIAFTSARDGNAEIYVMNADGSNQTRLTDNPANDLEPSWVAISTQLTKDISVLVENINQETLLGDYVNIPVKIKNEGTEAISKDTNILIPIRYKSVELGKIVSFDNNTVVLDKDISPGETITIDIPFWSRLPGQREMEVVAFLDKGFAPQFYPVVPANLIVADNEYDFSNSTDEDVTNNIIPFTLDTPEQGQWNLIELAGNYLTEHLGIMGNSLKGVLDDILTALSGGTGDTLLNLTFDFFNEVSDVLSDNYDSRDAASGIKIITSLKYGKLGIPLAAYHAVDIQERKYLRSMTVGMPLEKILNAQNVIDQMQATVIINPDSNNPLFKAIGHAYNENGDKTDISQEILNISKGFTSVYIEDEQGNKTGMVNGQLTADIPNSGVNIDDMMVYILTDNKTLKEFKFEGTDVEFVPYFVSTEDRNGNVRYYPIGSSKLAKSNFENIIKIDGEFTGKINPSTYQLTVDKGNNNTNDLVINATNDSDIDPGSGDGTGKIAFSSNRGGNWEIYVMNPDGTNPTSLTNNLAWDSNPAWSPDASKITFDSNRGGNWEIYVMNPDGSNLINLTNNPARDYHPAWSPNGSKVTFFSDRDGNWEIYVMNADGNNQTRLTNNPARDDTPTWSPDGSKIAFTSRRNGNEEIYVMNPDGSNQTRITNNPATSLSPAWSPDGSKIAFASERDGNYEIYVMNADGTNPTNLTNNPTNDYAPAWSPDIITSIDQDLTLENIIPELYSLKQNYPNPFNPRTTIQYSIPKPENVSLKIYGISGREVKTLVNEMQSKGEHSVVWDGTNNLNLRVASGMYIYRITTKSFSETKKMVLIK